MQKNVSLEWEPLAINQTHLLEGDGFGPPGLECLILAIGSRITGWENLFCSISTNSPP